MAWLHMPILVLNAYVAMMPRLRAEDSMRESTTIAAGSGVMDQKHRLKLVRSWERDAEGPAGDDVQGVSHDERLTMIASVGIDIGNG